MRKVTAIAAIVIVSVLSISAYAALGYVAGDEYSDGSYRTYFVYVAGEEDSPPDAPCRSMISYGQSWCTSSSNCLARAAAPPSIPKCAIPPSNPEWP